MVCIKLSWVYIFLFAVFTSFFLFKYNDLNADSFFRREFMCEVFRLSEIIFDARSLHESKCGYFVRNGVILQAILLNGLSYKAIIWTHF